MKKIILIMVSFICIIEAVNIDDVDVGDIYYVNGGWFDDDRRVIVVRVSHSKGKIKVRASNGDTEWVYPSKLLTKNENETQNIIQNPLTLLLGAVILGAATSESNEHDADGGYYIRVKNNCSETMKLAIYYKPFKSTEYKADGWWEIKPGEKSKLSENSVALTTKSAVLYYYAKSKYGDKYKIEGYNKVYLNGNKYWMKEVVDKDGATDIVLNCN